MLVLPICVGGTPKKHQKELFFMRCQAQTHTHLRNFFLCLIRKRTENISKNKATFFLSSVIVVEVHFLRELFEKFLFQVESASFWDESRWMSQFVKKIFEERLHISPFSEMCVNVSPCWNRIQWINECVTLLYSVEFTLSLKVGSTNFKFLAKIEILDMTWYHALSTHYHVRSRTGYKLARSRHVMGGAIR